MPSEHPTAVVNIGKSELSPGVSICVYSCKLQNDLQRFDGYLSGTNVRKVLICCVGWRYCQMELQQPVLLLPAFEVHQALKIVGTAAAQHQQGKLPKYIRLRKGQYVLYVHSYG